MSYESEYKHSNEVPAPISDQKLAEIFTAVMARVYGWMTLGLLVTAVVSLVVANNPEMMSFFFSSTLAYFGMIIGMFVLIFAIGRAARKMAPAQALALYFVFAGLMGVWLSFIFLAYAPDAIVFTFGLTAAIFLVLTVLGLTTKQDLTRWGPILLVALFGLIAASIVNIFINSPTLYWIVSYAGVLIFMGLIAYDSQRIKKMTYAAATEGANQQEVVSRIGIMGALSLYLDFINLFLFLLRIFGRR